MSATTITIDEAFENWNKNLSSDDEHRIREWIAKGNFTVVARLIFFAAWKARGQVDAKAVRQLGDMCADWSGDDAIAEAANEIERIDGTVKK